MAVLESMETDAPSAYDAARGLRRAGFLCGGVALVALVLAAIFANQPAQAEPQPSQTQTNIPPILGALLGEAMTEQGASWATLQIKENLSAGLAAWSTGALDEAGQHLRKALRLSEMSGDVALTASAFHLMGELAAERGEWYWATKYVNAALNRYEMLDDPTLQGEAHRRLAYFAAERDNPAAAVDEFRRAAVCYEQDGNGLERVAVLREWAVYAANLGDTDEAQRLTRLASRVEAEYAVPEDNSLAAASPATAQTAVY